MRKLEDIDQSDDGNGSACDAFWFRLPFLSGGVRGRQAVHFLYAAVLCGIVACMVWYHEDSSAKRAGELLTNQQSILLAVQEAIKAQNDAKEEQSYILSLSAEQRTALKLTMPASLRKRLTTEAPK